MLEKQVRTIAALIGASFLAIFGIPLAQAGTEKHLRISPARTAETVAERSYFYVHGTYAGDTANKIMHGQMYVERWAPAKSRHKYPLLLIHGAGQTATNWMGTPDGRQGWAEFFVSQGYVVYMVDQPARGRSAWQPGVDGTLRAIDVETVEHYFTAPEQTAPWPQAKLHTQWPGEGPGKGRAGDPIFDELFASQVPFVADNAESEIKVTRSVSALLDKIGPVILVTHSQSGPFGWLIADARPKLVKGIVAIEPSGPPFQNAVRDEKPARPWGLTETPITYDPPVTDPAQLEKERQSVANGPGLVPCWQQKGPVRQWKNLRDIPVVLITGEASYHAPYDHCTARYLNQVGVKTDFYRLEEQGIRGNGHMVMLEKNNLEIAGLISDWISKKVK